MLCRCFYACRWLCFFSQSFVPGTAQQLRHPLFCHLRPFENSPRFLLVAQPPHPFAQKPFNNFPWGTLQVFLLIPNTFCFEISPVLLSTRASSLACWLKDMSPALLPQVPPRKSPCSSQGLSNRIQTFPEKSPAYPCLVWAQQHVLPMSLCFSFLCTLVSVVLLHLTEDIILIYAMLLRSYCIILHYWCFRVCNWENKGQRHESSAEGIGLLSCLPGLGRQ